MPSMIGALQVAVSVLLVGARAEADANAAGGRRIVIILAPPCGGAGTHSPNIVRALGIPHLDAGHILREAATQGTPLGLQAKKMMDAGEFVPDHLVNGIFANRIGKPDCAHGALLDGYPRDVNQSKFLDAMLAASGEAVSDVVLIDVPKRGLQECVEGRWGAPNGATYNANFIGGRRPKSLPPGEDPVCDPADLTRCNMFDDETGEPLSRRSDDNLQTLDKRLKVYHRETEPLLARYQKVLIEVDGDRPIPEVWADIAKGLGVDASDALDVASGDRAPAARTTDRLAFLTLTMLATVICMPVALVLRSKRQIVAGEDYQHFSSPAGGRTVRLLPS